MQCKFVLGPNAGKVVHLPNNPTTDLMIQCGVLELMEAPAPKPAPVHPDNTASAAMRNVLTPEWDVFISTGVHQNRPTIRLNVARTEYFYSGPVENAAQHFKRGGHEVPQSILERYARLKAAPAPQPTGPMISEAESQRLEQNRLSNKVLTYLEASPDGVVQE